MKPTVIPVALLMFALGNSKVVAEELLIFDLWAFEDSVTHITGGQGPNNSDGWDLEDTKGWDNATLTLFFVKVPTVEGWDKPACFLISDFRSPKRPQLWVAILHRKGNICPYDLYLNVYGRYERFFQASAKVRNSSSPPFKLEKGYQTLPGEKEGYDLIFTVVPDTPSLFALLSLTMGFLILKRYY